MNISVKWVPLVAGTEAEPALQCLEKVFWKDAANLQENAHAKVSFQ